MSLFAAVMICATVVNIQTHTQQFLTNPHGTNCSSLKYDKHIWTDRVCPTKASTSMLSHFVEPTRSDQTPTDTDTHCRHPHHHVI